jgi:hypothetical protein
LQSVDISTAAAGAPALPMRGAWSTIRSYILWQHERGTLHYDIMVTLILIFVFFSPRVIDFNDKPSQLDPHPTDVVVSTDGSGGLIYEITGSAVRSGDDAAIRGQLMRIIEPISGDVAILKYEGIAGHKDQVESYRVWAKRK